MLPAGTDEEYQSFLFAKNGTTDVMKGKKLQFFKNSNQPLRSGGPGGSNREEGRRHTLRAHPVLRQKALVATILPSSNVIGLDFFLLLLLENDTLKKLT